MQQPYFDHQLVGADILSGALIDQGNVLNYRPPNSATSVFETLHSAAVPRADDAFFLQANDPGDGCRSSRVEWTN